MIMFLTIMNNNTDNDKNNTHKETSDNKNN